MEKYKNKSTKIEQLCFCYDIRCHRKKIKIYEISLFPAAAVGKYFCLFVKY